MQPQPPFNPDQIIAAIVAIAHALANFVVANPLVAVFILVAIAIVAQLPPIALLLIILVAVAYLLR